MARIVITDRDIEILKMVSRVGFLTETQICTLFFSKNDGFTLDLTRARNALAQRISRLVCNKYLEKTAIPSSGWRNRVAYLLGLEGAEVLKNTREIESKQDYRWLSRKANHLLIRSRHDLVTTNFLVNLIMLARLLSNFHLVEWIPDRDCRFYIPRGDKKLVVNPDLYFNVQSGSPGGRHIFLEVDNDTLDKKALRIKLTRFFQYYASRKYKRDLECALFPRICILTPSDARLEVMKTAIIDAKKHHADAVTVDVSRMPFCLATFENVEVNSIDNGFVTKKPLEPVWVNENGLLLKSPLIS